MFTDRTRKYVLTVAGSDSIGGAGIQADVRTISALGGHALTAVTAVTAQNSLGILGIHPVPAPFVSRQMETVIRDVAPDAVKIGMVYTGATIRAVAGVLRRFEVPSLVLDPVLKASVGGVLLKPPMVSLLIRVLFPLATVVTPNLEEAGILTGRRVTTLEEMEEACRAIKAMGPHVVVTGGHLKGDCVDLLYDGREMQPFRGPRVETRDTHGTGCVFSSALATLMGAGFDLGEAVERAGAFTRGSLEGGYPCGHGPGVVNPDRGALGDIKRNRRSGRSNFVTTVPR